MAVTVCIQAVRSKELPKSCILKKCTGTSHERMCFRKATDPEKLEAFVISSASGPSEIGKTKVRT